jgi:hypothetical protein
MRKIKLEQINEDRKMAMHFMRPQSNHFPSHSALLKLDRNSNFGFGLNSSGPAPITHKPIRMVSLPELMETNKKDNSKLVQK